MSYIYHLRPEPFEGHDLVPLNMMDKNSESYQQNIKKYEGREHLMETTIPKLGCRWNDVIHFSALDPQIIVNELKFINPHFQLWRTHYFKIPVAEIVDLHKIAVLDRKVARPKSNYFIDDFEVELLTLKNYQEIFEIPRRTYEYWDDVKKNGGAYYWFPFVPHVFIQGKINPSSFEVCELKI